MLIMSRGGYAELPDGSVVVALTLPRPGSRAARIPARRAAEPDPYRRRRWSAHADEAHTVRAATVAHRPGEEPRVRVLVHALNRSRALTRLRNLGLRAVYLNGNSEPPTADEVTAVLHHPEGLVWRATHEGDRGSWHPIATLLRGAVA
jgi:hypothetical protein